MTLKLRLFLYFIATISAVYASGQMSLRHPLICHDHNNYLRCYNDGTYRMTFAEGNFKTFKTTDGRISYSDTNKTFTFWESQVAEPSLTDNNADTIQLQLLSHSIVLKKGMSSMEITSLSDISPEIGRYHLGTYSTTNIVRGFSCWAGDKFVEIEVWDNGKNWYWNIYIRHSSQRFGIRYSGVKENRVMMIGIQDDGLRFGMSISMTFKSWKKISILESLYINTVDSIDVRSIIGRVPLGNNYRYEYTKTGKLKQKRIVGELKLCDCD